MTDSIHTSISSLRSVAGPSLASSSELSPDGKTLTLNLPSGATVSLDATAKHTVSHGDGTFSYSLASLYLQIVNPDQSLLQYRQACKKYGVSDGVKATDKGAVIGFFGGSGSGDEVGSKPGDDEEAGADREGQRDRDDAVSSERRKDDESGSRRSDGDRDRDRHRERDRDRDDRHRREKDKHRDRDRDRDRDRHHRDKDRRHSSAEHRHRDRDRDHHRHRDDKDRRHSSDHHHRRRDHKDKHDRDRERRHKHDKHHRRSGEHDKRGREDRHHHHSDDKRSSSKKSAKAPITNEKLMEHLDTVVGKRTQPGKKMSAEEGAVPPAEASAKEGKEGPTEGGGAAKDGAEGEGQSSSAAQKAPPAPVSEDEDEAALLRRCLSSKGFEVRNLTSEIEADRPAVERIAASEIPVGDSASVLRCGGALADGGGGGGGSGGGAGGNNGNGSKSRDFGRVLELYNEVLKAEEEARKGGGRATPGGGKRGAPPPPGSDPKRARPGQPGAGGTGAGAGTKQPAGKPIIIIPNAMTSPITMINARQFFQDSLFVPRDVAMKQSGRKRLQSINVRRRVAPRLGGGEVEYEIVDNPATRLQRSADWDRVVAVLAQGAAWQFKGWKVSNPVDIFNRTFGFYVGMEGAPIPGEIKGWAVKIGTLNRDKRGLDSVTSASFWNGLDEWMSVHKPQYLPSAD